MRWLLNGPMVLIAPIYVGWVYDTTGNYTNVFVLFTILLAVTGTITCFIIPPKSKKVTIVDSVKVRN
jgi:cyanate permease